MKAILLVLLVCIAASANAVTVALKPTADTYVDSSDPYANFGGSTDIWAFTEGTTQYELLTKIPLTSIPANATITSATMIYRQQWAIQDELYGPYVVFNVYEIDTNWTDYGPTWNNKPAKLRNGVALLTDYQDNDIDKIKFPVTQAVKDARSKGAVAFLVSSAYPTVCAFSKDVTGSQYQPYLSVTYY
jgi:hypothetical protein